MTTGIETIVVAPLNKNTSDKALPADIEKIGMYWYYHQILESGRNGNLSFNILNLWWGGLKSGTFFLSTQTNEETVWSFSLSMMSLLHP